MLNGLQLQTYDDFPAMAFTANYVLKLAQEIWEHQPASLGAMADVLKKGPQTVE